jgi:hypothetical protein
MGNAAMGAGARGDLLGRTRRCLEQLQPGDLLFTDWGGGPDLRLTGDPDSAGSPVPGEAADRGVDVRSRVREGRVDTAGVSVRAVAAEAAQVLRRLLAAVAAGELDADGPLGTAVVRQLQGSVAAALEAVAQPGRRIH